MSFLRRLTGKDRKATLVKALQAKAINVLEDDITLSRGFTAARAEYVITLEKSISRQRFVELGLIEGQDFSVHRHPRLAGYRQFTINATALEKALGIYSPGHEAELQ